MALPKNSIRFYFRNKEALVAAVGGWLPYLTNDSRLIMTIKQVRSGDFSVCFVTGMSSDGTVDPTGKRSFGVQPTILPAPTPGG